MGIFTAEKINIRRENIGTAQIRGFFNHHLVSPQFFRDLFPDLLSCFSTIGHYKYTPLRFHKE
jgi:hypothetical protein